MSLQKNVVQKLQNSREVVGSETDLYYTVLSFLNSVIHHA